ncbi:hypothetical protein G3I19_35495, partial [Streptomyces sp. SID10853]|uniref:GvpL/GvpF family gas vesicle protein n=1 Tax=Streptomyces sp. SID10853 TaxID=2706028 RepID=UPI0013C1E1A9
AVRELAAGAVRRRPHGPEATGRGRTQIMNAAYLIAGERSGQLARTVGRLRDALGPDGIEIEVSGPWAPYSFTDSFTDPVTDSCTDPVTDARTDAITDGGAHADR